MYWLIKVLKEKTRHEISTDWSGGLTFERAADSLHFPKMCLRNVRKAKFSAWLFFRVAMARRRGLEWENYLAMTKVGNCNQRPGERDLKRLPVGRLSIVIMGCRPQTLTANPWGNLELSQATRKQLSTAKAEACTLKNSIITYFIYKAALRTRVHQSSTSSFLPVLLQLQLFITKVWPVKRRFPKETAPQKEEVQDSWWKEEESANSKVSYFCLHLHRIWQIQFSKLLSYSLTAAEEKKNSLAGGKQATTGAPQVAIEIMQQFSASLSGNLSRLPATLCNFHTYFRLSRSLAGLMSLFSGNLDTDSFNWPENPYNGAGSRTAANQLPLSGVSTRSWYLWQI